MKNSDEQPYDDSYDEAIEVKSPKRKKRCFGLNEDPDYYPSDNESLEESNFDSSLKRTTRKRTIPDRSKTDGEKTLEETKNITRESGAKNKTPDYVSSDDEYDEPFEQCYRSFPLCAMDKGHLEDGNRIIMPHSALERLAKLDIDYPMMFEIKKNGSDGRVSHCGVLEFSAQEGLVCLPVWMMKNLGVCEGEVVMMKNASLKKGTFMKIQPHQTAFINLPDAKEVLEAGLRGYSCVTTGDTICIPHKQARFLIDIVETKPEKAISVVETDCVVDFAPPLDYKEPEKKSREEVIPGNGLEKKPKVEEEKAKFQPFSGQGRRLDDVLVESGSSLPVHKMTTNAHERENLPKKLDACNCEPKKSSPSSGKSGRENSRTEEKMFKPFTGNKYTLNG